MIRILGDPALTKACHSVNNFGPSLVAYLQFMYAAMEMAGGIGLADNQLGGNEAIFIMMLRDGHALAVINPIIIHLSREVHIFEHDGCLSIPGVFSPVVRHDSITINYQDEYGEEHESVFEGLEAVIVQHEMDHLSGKLYIDRVGPLKREFLLKKYRKLSKKV